MLRWSFPAGSLHDSAGSETTHGGSLRGWVQVVGAVVLAIWRLVMIPSSAAREILRMDGLAAEQHPGKGRLTGQP
jgi:hypothetical protein